MKSATVPVSANEKQYSTLKNTPELILINTSGHSPLRNTAERFTAYLREIPMQNETITEVMIFLDDSFTVPQKFYDAVCRQVTDIEPALILGAQYTLKKLCEPEYWNSLTMYERRVAGRCMKHLVENELVPYDFAGWICQQPKKYTVIR